MKTPDFILWFLGTVVIVSVAAGGAGWHLAITIHTVESRLNKEQIEAKNKEIEELKIQVAKLERQMHDLTALAWPEIHVPFRNAYLQTGGSLGKSIGPASKTGKTQQTFLRKEGGDKVHLLLWWLTSNRVYLIENGTWKSQLFSITYIAERESQEYVDRLACRELECPAEGLHAPTGGLYGVWKEWGLKDTHGWAMRNCVYDDDSVYWQRFENGQIIGPLRANDGGEPIVLALVQKNTTRNETSGTSERPRLLGGIAPTCKE